MQVRRVRADRNLSKFGANLSSRSPWNTCFNSEDIQTKLNIYIPTYLYIYSIITSRTVSSATLWYYIALTWFLLRAISKIIIVDYNRGGKTGRQCHKWTIYTLKLKEKDTKINWDIKLKLGER